MSDTTTTSKANSPAPNPSSPQSPRFWRWLVGAFLSLWWLFVAALAAGIASYLGNHTGPTVLPLLPQVLDWARKQALWVQIGLTMLALLLIGAMVWLTILAWKRRQERQVEGVQESIKTQTAAFTNALEQDVNPRLTEANIGIQEIAAQSDVIRKQNAAIIDQGAQIEQQVTIIAAHLIKEAPLVPDSVRATSLPRPVTLIGRGHQLARIIALLKGESVTGVVALEGMGGVGKSALAAEAVARLANEAEFPGGAVWVAAEALTSAQGLGEIWTRVARELGLSHVLAMSDAEARRIALATALASRPHTLLALDNLERELDILLLIDTLAIPGHTTLLLTSRYTLAAQKLSAITITPLNTTDAATLLYERLRQIDAARPNTEDDLHIADLAALTGGLPLAVELVANYTGIQRLHLATVIEQLKQDGLSAAALNDALYPQRALATTFGRSWDVLSKAQQCLFAGLSLLAEASFPRGVALAIAKVAHQQAGDESAPSMLYPNIETDLAALVSYSLIEPLAGERLRLHPLLRGYASKKLAASLEDQVDQLGDAALSYWITYVRSNLEGDLDVASTQFHHAVDIINSNVECLQQALNWAHSHNKDKAFWELMDLTTIVEQSGGNYTAFGLILPTVVATGYAKEDALDNFHLSVNLYYAMLSRQ